MLSNMLDSSSQAFQVCSFDTALRLAAVCNHAAESWKLADIKEFVKVIEPDAKVYSDLETENIPAISINLFNLITLVL